MFFSSVLDLLILKFATNCKLKIHSLAHKKEIRMETLGWDYNEFKSQSSKWVKAKMVHRWIWTNHTHNNLEFGEESPHLFMYYILWLMARIHQHCKKMFGFLLKILFFQIMKFAILWAHDSHTQKINWRIFY